jgi:D-methionine transport system ATP-binding protein
VVTSAAALRSPDPRILLDTAAVDLRDVTKTFVTPNGPLRAVDRVSLCVVAGSIHGIIGLSGAGKSTLLRIINLLERPDDGEVVVDGRDLTRLRDAEVREARRGIGMIFQHFNLLNNLTVYENVALPLEISGVAANARRAIVEDRLATVGLTDKLRVYPAKLSGGQKQRVAIARALATQPRLLLCDEPTSSVDPETKGTILGYLREVNRRYGITIVIVTHEMSVIRAVCDVVTVLERGRVVEEFAPNDVRHQPRSGIAKFLARTEIVLDPTDVPEEVLSR